MKLKLNPEREMLNFAFFEKKRSSFCFAFWQMHCDPEQLIYFRGSHVWKAVLFLTCQCFITFNQVFRILAFPK